MIADEVIERVRAAADIVQIISEYVPLKRQGTDFRGPCPFHNGTKPNFSVQPRKNMYHCFVCHESGDVFTFLRKRLGLDWVAAVTLVGERVGIEVIDQPTRAYAPDPNERNWEVLATTAEWFRAQLDDEAIGREARAYLEGRGIDSEACRRFGIGFAPRDADAMRRHLSALGFDEARMLDAGVLYRREDESATGTRFRDRIMFPILDELGHHVGFGGRAMGNSKAKYINSGESLVFQKRRTLYGLHTAKQAMRKAGRAIVVEGYLDAIRLALVGVEEVVAPLGTALTTEQVELLMRYSQEVFLLYDSDAAGQKATFNSGLELLRHKATVRVVSLPEGEDPDTFARKHGRAAVETQLTNAIDLFDRQIQLCERKGLFADLRKSRVAIDKLLPTIRAARDALTHDLYLARLSEVSHVDKATLASEADEPPLMRAGLRPIRAEDSTTENGTQATNVAPDDNSAPSPSAAPVKRQWNPRRGKPLAPEWHSTLVPPRARHDDAVERGIVRAMLVDRALVERVAARYSPSVFRDETYRAIFEELRKHGHAYPLDAIADALPPTALRVFQELIESSQSLPLEAADVTLSLLRLDARPLEERIDELRIAMSTAPPNEYDAMMQELTQLQREVRTLLPIRSPRGKPKA